MTRSPESELRIIDEKYAQGLAGGLGRVVPGTVIEKVEAVDPLRANGTHFGTNAAHIIATIGGAKPIGFEQWSMPTHYGLITVVLKVDPQDREKYSGALAATLGTLIAVQSDDDKQVPRAALLIGFPALLFSGIAYSIWRRIKKRGVPTDLELLEQQRRARAKSSSTPQE